MQGVLACYISSYSVSCSMYSILLVSYLIYILHVTVCEWHIQIKGYLLTYLSFFLSLLFASNVFEANNANILWEKRTAFTCLAITPPKVDRFGWNLEQCEPNVGGWPWYILGAICTVAIVWERAKIVFFCEVNKAQFHRFPFRKLLDIWTQRWLVRQWKLSKQNFEILP